MTTLFDGKVCVKCGAWHPFADYYRNSRGSGDGYETTCKGCYVRRQRAYHSDNRAAISDRRRERYASDPDHRAKVLGESEAYRRSHPQEKYARDRAYALSNIERTRAYKRAYEQKLRSTDPKRYYAWVASKVNRRKARKLGNGGTFTRQQWQDLCAQYGNMCLRCGEVKKLTVDHVVPLSLGGTNDISNIQPLCMSCNVAKHDRHIDYRPSEG